MANVILTIGGDGFIGTNLKKFSREYSFLEFGYINLRQKDISKTILDFAITNGSKTILNLGWTSNSSDNYQDLDENFEWAEFTVQLAQILLENNMRFIGVGSCLDDIENTPNNYVKSKKITRFQLENKYGTHKDFSWIRPFYVYSLKEKRPRILKQISENSNGEMVLANCNVHNDYISIQDVAAGFKLVLDHEISGVIDIGTGKLTSNHKFANFVASNLNMIMPQCSDYSEYIEGPKADISKLTEFGWKPVFTKRDLTF